MQIQFLEIKKSPSFLSLYHSYHFLVLSASPRGIKSSVAKTQVIAKYTHETKKLDPEDPRFPSQATQT